MKPTPDQKYALDEIVDWAANPTDDRRELSLSGPAGTGKTTLMRLVAKSLRRVRGVSWTAMTGKAARRMREAAGVEATTLHSQLYWPPPERPDHLRFEDIRPWTDEKFGRSVNDIAVVDEASMVTPKIKQDIENWILGGGRILYVGDGYQLPPILGDRERNEWGEHYTIFEDVRGPKLSKVIRNDDDILNVATYIREEGKLPVASTGAYEFRAAAIRTGIIDYLKDPDDHAMITWRNRLRMAVNASVRRHYGYDGKLPQPGEQILFCRNGHGVTNGQSGTVASIVEAEPLGPVDVYRLSVAEDDVASVPVTITGREKPMDGALPALSGARWDEYREAVKLAAERHRELHGVRIDPRPVPITWGYCLTAHKAQGSEYRRVTVMLTDADTNARPMRMMTKLPDGENMSFAMRWLYTAITRAKHRATVVVGSE